MSGGGRRNGAGGRGGVRGPRGVRGARGAGAGAFRGAAKQGPIKKPAAKSAASVVTPTISAPKPVPAAPLRVGFFRGIAPEKWARRYRDASGQQVELVPLPAVLAPRGAPVQGAADVAGAAVAGAADDAPPLDVTLERVASGAQPAGYGNAAAGESEPRHAIRLYEEQVALVYARDSEIAELELLAELTSIDAAFLADLAAAGLKLLDHPDHDPAWPATEHWLDPSWMPATARDALDIVATGAGAVLLPLPAARHLAGKRRHRVIEVTGLPGTCVWACWPVARDADDVQWFAGILRGRTARSAR